MATRCSSQRPDQVNAAAHAARQVAQGSTLRDLIPAALLLSVGLVALLAASLTSDHRPGQYLVIGAPWASHGRMIGLIRKADGGLAAMGGFGNIAIAASSRGDFAARARQAGAWAVLPSPRIAGCFGLQSEASHP